MTEPFPEYGGNGSGDEVPRAELRATDDDRKKVARRLKSAVRSGELTRDEYEHRHEATMRARTYGDLGELTVDLAGGRELAIPESREAEVHNSRARAGGLLNRMPVTVRPWLFVAMITNVIWYFTSLSSDEGWYYYWPMWPMLGMLIPILAEVLFGGSDEESEDADEK